MRDRQRLNFRFLTGFTLVEVMITLVILGIIVGFAVPSYWNSRQRALDQEAKGMLKLVQAAQEVAKAESGSYVICNAAGGNTNQCNTLLNLDFPPTGASQRWDILVPVGNLTDFCSNATRTNNPSNFWVIWTNWDEANQTGTCP